MKNKDNCISIVSITKAICIVLLVILPNLVSALDAAVLTLTIPDDVTIECTEDETSANTGEATATSTCGTVTITQSSEETDDCGRTKTITRTWTATDTCGDSTSAIQIITVEDTTPPELDLPDDITIECGEDESSLNTGLAFGQDTCSGVRISSTDVVIPGCGNTKTILRTWLVTDNCVNPTTGVQTITVQDTTPPTLIVPDDITIECNADESSTNTGVATASDTCGAVTSITQSDIVTAACGSTKTIVRTWSATDICGNTASVDQIITVQDTTPPTLTIPNNITIECGEDESSTNTGIATGTDTCGSVSITQSDVATDDCGNTKTITRTWTATDACGNTTSADQIIIVEDTTPPSLLLPDDITIECGEDDSSANTGLGKAEDDCGSVSIIESDFVTPGCGNTSTIIRTWTTFDNCGNSTTGRQIITVADTTPPVIDDSALENITIQCGITPDGALEAWLLNNAGATATDTCGNIIWSNDFSGNTDVDCTSGAIPVTFTATDDCGNSESTTATYSIIDTINPVLTIPADVTIDCTEDTSPTNNGTATATDDCTAPSITFSDSEIEACGITKTITRTWTATDDCGNATSADQIIIVEDTTAPVIDNSGIENITIQCGVTPDGSLDAWLLNNAGATATESCGSVTWSNDFNGNIDVDCANGAISVTFTATDDCGNTASTSASYSIIDTINPILIIPADVTIECTDDTTPAGTGMATASDDCTQPDVTFSDSETTACGATKTIMRTWTAMDDCGNTSSAIQTIIVQDTTPPTFTVPENIIVECDVDVTDVTITGDVTDEADNCDTNLEASYSDIRAEGDCANSAVISRTWSLIDACDNVTTLIQTITIQDTVAPTFTVPDDITLECDIDSSDLSITGDVTDESDNCSNALEAAYTDEIIEGNCDNAYIIKRSWTLTDDCDNTTTLIQTITVQDTTAPTFTVPVDISVECDLDVTDLTVTGDVTDENDNCDTGLEASFTDSVAPGNCANTSIITRTWTLTDNCENATALVQTITVQDTTAPTFDIDLPTELTVECDAIPDTDAVTASDNCGEAIVTLEESTTSGSCDNAFTLVRIWTATDSCDNETVITQTITVQDTTVPSFNEDLPANLTIECDAEVPTAVALTATDNCGTAEVLFVENTTDGSCMGNLTIERVWTATDSCGNAAVHIQIITVQDTTAPTLVTPFDEAITVLCADIPQIPDLTFEDSCSNNIAVSFNEVSTQINDFEDYEVIRTWTVTDDCDNEGVFTQTITVEINNVITPVDANRCILDVEFDLFDLLSGDFDMDGAWSVVSGDATLDGSLFDPASVEVGNYTFNYAITEGACPNEVDVNVAVDDACVVLPCGAEDVIISKTVTANGDSYNEFFTITGVEDCGFVVELQIFNRWGAEVYKSSNYQNNWNGDAHGSSAGSSGKVPTGTYYYIINLRNSGLEPFAGPIYVATNK